MKINGFAAHWREPTVASQGKGGLPNLHGPLGHRDGLALLYSSLGFLHERGNHGWKLVLGKKDAVGVGEFLAPLKVFSEHIFKVFTGANLDNGLVERLGGAKALGVLGSHLAKHHATAIFSKDLDHQIVMAAQYPDTFFKSWIGQ